MAITETDLEAAKEAARTWFEDLRDQICKAFEDLEDELPKGMPKSLRPLAGLKEPHGSAPTRPPRKMAAVVS